MGPDGSDQFNDLTKRGRGLLSSHGDAVREYGNFNYWVDSVATWLESFFPGTGAAAAWSGLRHSPLVAGNQYHDYPAAWNEHTRAIRERLQWLAELYSKSVAARVAAPQSKQEPNPPNSNRVFIVHGHDETIKEQAARLVEKLDLEAVILHEQPNKGRTVIEKFTDHADAAFAIVLLTADDIGGTKGTKPDGLSYRARQNVILELGYFIGRLGRGRVAALYTSGVEMPSDYQGVVFTKIDDGGAWRLSIAKEMKAAGLDVDMNLV